MKYIRKQSIVSAEEYKPGMEDGFDDISYQGLAGEPKKDTDPYVLVENGGRMKFVFAGDMVVTYENGDRLPMNRERFNENYELLSNTTWSF